MCVFPTQLTQPTQTPMVVKFIKEKISSFTLL